MSEKYRAAESEKQNHTDKRIGGEKRRVQPAQIIGTHQRMLVNQKRPCRYQSHDGEYSQVRQKV
jgi:hypothetical protein